MKDYKNYLNISDSQYKHIEKNLSEYHYYDQEEAVTPKIIIYLAGEKQYKTPELISSPEVMLQQALERAQTHINIGDDYIPSVCVDFGTGQVPHAFGCEMFVPEDSPVCVVSHVLENIEDVEQLNLPSTTAGWFGKSYEYIKFLKDNKPEIMGIELPDFQSPFNNAYQVRGDDIFMDFYDEPEKLEKLLSLLAAYQIQQIKYFRELLNMEEGYIYDLGMFWKGNARLTNCAMHMISTEFYNEFIKKHDSNIIQTIGGGRIHYCGTHDNGLMESFGSIEQMYGIDYDGRFHDFRILAEQMPSRAALLQYMTPKQIKELLNGDWGNIRKNNVILHIGGPSSVEEGKELYRKLKKSYEDSLLKGY